MGDDEKRSIPDRVHDLYYKAFPGADCPVTGAGAKEKLMAASRSQQQQASSGSPSSSGSAGSAAYKHPHVFDVYGRRIDEEAVKQQTVQQEAWRMPLFLYNSTFHTVGEMDRTVEEINPANKMPKNANQQPAPGQREPLSTSRQQSTIPKGGTRDTWLYPSPQMFFNSLVRKGKDDGVTEKDMDAVVATHNSMNEATWIQLLQWERLYSRLYPDSAADEPRLLHFVGRPHDLTPKARLKKFLGYGEPFDRHDWTVDRGGREMRYVIDFYYHERPPEDRTWPFEVDVRPALDSRAGVLLRARMLVHEAMEAAGVSASPPQQSPA